MSRAASTIKGFAMVSAATLAWLMAAYPGNAAPAACENNVLTNGDFEQGPKLPPVGFIQLNSVSLKMTNWIVSAGNIDYVGPYWQAASGTHSVDMSGLVAGTIYQNAKANALHNFTLTFDLSGNPDGPRGVKTLEVGACFGKFVPPLANCAFTTTFTYDTSANAMNNTRANMNYQPQTWTFSSNAIPSISLVFESQTNTPFGPVIDNVCVVDTGPIDGP